MFVRVFDFEGGDILAVSCVFKLLFAGLVLDSACSCDSQGYGQGAEECITHCECVLPHRFHISI